MGCNHPTTDQNEEKKELNENQLQILKQNEISLLDKSARLIRYLFVKFDLIGSFKFGLNGKTATISVTKNQLMSVSERLKINLRSKTTESIIEDNIYYEILVYMFYINLKTI